MCTDHSHYFEDGGATYHNRYSSYEAFRGQEGDRWKCRLDVGEIEQKKYQKMYISSYQHAANKKAMVNEEDLSSVKTFEAGMEFIRKYHGYDNWFLQIESFDPHEPYYVPEKYRALYDLGKIDINWPAYMPCDDELDKQTLAKEYASLLTMCDTYLGKILDLIDGYGLWDESMIIVNTDHGFLLGEHNYLGKNWMPLHDEIIHIPFFMHLPNVQAREINQLAGTIDIAPTLLDYFGLEIPENMEGRSLLQVLKEEKVIHDYLIFGTHGGHVSITDGEYVYMKASANAENRPFVECTLMPENQRGFFNAQQLQSAKLVEGDKYSNGLPYLKMEGVSKNNSYIWGDMLLKGVQQDELLHDEAVEVRMKDNLARIMEEVQAPIEEFERLGLKK